MKKTSRFALAGATGLLMGGLALTDARAADLGGNCCADLEERVAELEATTARKGNKKVSLEISGQVNRALLVFDDGQDSDAFVVDNAYSGSRFRFKGTAQMKPGWTAGFLIEIAVADNSSDDVSAFDDEGGNDNNLNTRHASLFIESERLGRVTIGQTSPSTDDIILISTADTGGFTSIDTLYNTGFTARGAEGIGGGVSWGILTGNFGGNINLDTSRGDFVRYDTPALWGFILSAAWGENDIWDISLRYAKEWNSFKIAAGIGYQHNGERANDGLDIEEIKGSASVKHTPTGLFANFAFVEREFDDADFEDALAWYVQAGIEKNWFSYGPTVVYGEYGNYKDFGDSFGVFDSDVNRWGVGVAQSFDSAATQIYAAFQYFEADASNVENIEDMSLAVVGARIKF